MITKNKDFRKRKILKIDVESAEWNSLNITDVEILYEFD